MAANQDCAEGWDTDYRRAHPGRQGLARPRDEAQRASLLYGHGRFVADDDALDTNAGVAVTPSYDDKQLGAVLLSWLCCRRTVYATAPEIGCLTCR